MSTEILSEYEFIDMLPAGSTTFMHGRSWEDYEGLLSAVSERRGLRITFTDGTLQIMTLSPEHEKYSGFIHDLVRLVSLHLGIKVLFFGSVTMKRRLSEKGTEPDECFYVQTAKVIAGKTRIDFATDPPPDVAVEVDLTHESISKFPIYKALGVPEIWVYDGKLLMIYQLERGQYQKAAASSSIPILTATVLNDFLDQCQRGDQFEALREFQRWLMNQKS